MTFSSNFFASAAEICKSIDTKAVDRMAEMLEHLRNRGGRLFIVGNGGGAANASHAVNDFRKLCNIEAYAPTDNVAELTARINDEGWDSVFSGWLRVSDLGMSDALLVFSVGGGNREKNISTNIVKAIEVAKTRQAKVLAVVGREDGFAAKEADAAIVVPSPNPLWITPMTEAFQALIWHCLVSYPRLKIGETKW
jgi:D-sedoheptulose 7-phosphate isomerase